MARLFYTYIIPETEEKQPSALGKKAQPQVAKKADVSKLLLTHFYPELDKSLYVEEAKEIFSNVEGAEEFNYSGATDKLQVIYKSGRELFYENVHGTWGFPVEFK